MIRSVRLWSALHGAAGEVVMIEHHSSVVSHGLHSDGWMLEIPVP